MGRYQISEFVLDAKNLDYKTKNDSLHYVLSLKQQFFVCQLNI